jgi:hypothetical protein
MQPQQSQNDTQSSGGFWVNLVRGEVIVQVVWAVVIGAVAITAIVVFGGK